MPTAVWAAAPGQRAALPSAAASVLATWHVRSGFVRFWIDTACDRAPDLDGLRVVLDYDEQAGLLSFDAFSGDNRVYGADDWVG